MNAPRERGQMQQLFLFIIAIIVVGTTIYVGIRLIGGLSATGCESAKVKFMDDISVALTENSVAGSRNVVSVMPSCDARTLCFVDTQKVASGAALTGDIDQTIKLSVSNKIKTNVFVRDDEGVQGFGYDERIRVDGSAGAFCIEPKNGRFTFRTEGHTRTVTLSAQSS